MSISLNELSKEKDYRTNQAIRGVFGWFMNQLNPTGTTDANGKKDNTHVKYARKLNDAVEIMCRMTGDLNERIKMVTSKPRPPENNEEKENKFGVVYLGTLHSSKGLEFDNVWLLSMSDGIIPDLQEYTDETHDEERRLFYVGMTRSKNTLTISAVNNPSSFIDETGIEIEILD
jgi:hypothetical protein